METGTSSERDEGMKRSTLGSGGQISRSHEGEDRFVGLTKKLSFDEVFIAFAVVCILRYSAC